MDDNGPYQFLSTYTMAPCNPGEKEGWGHSALSEISFYCKEGHVRIAIKFSVRKT